MRKAYAIALLGLLSAADADSADIGVVPSKLVIIDDLANTGKAKALFVSKDPGATKGSGVDVELISVEVYVRYEDGSAEGAFIVPPGTASGWLLNKETAAKFVNEDAPDGATQVSRASIKPAKLLSLMAKGIGDTPLDIVLAGDPNPGRIEAAFCVTNDGERNCHCSTFAGCAYKLTAAGTGAKIVCRIGEPDPLCGAVEQDPPETSLGDAPDDPTNEAEPTFEFTSTELWSTFQCQLDGEGFAPCESVVGYTALADGLHTFEVYAVDIAGNPDATPAVHVWTVDTAAPTTSLTVAPPSAHNDSTPAFQFLSSEVLSTFRCRVLPEAFAPCATPHVTAPLADGVHTFEVRAVDLARNSGPAASHVWTVDTAAPATSLTDAPPSADNDSTPAFQFGSDEAGSTFQCRVLPDALAPCVSPHTAAALADGDHTFEVHAVDPAGNLDATPASHTWTVDTIAPVTSLTATPPNPGNDSTPTFQFNSDEVGSTFQCRVLPDAFAPCTSPFTSASLADGSRTFEVHAVDLAGNTDATPASHTWIVDTAAPTTSLNVAPSNPNNDSTPTFQFSSSEVGSTFQCRVVPAAFAPCTSPHTTAALGDGSRTFEVYAIDSAGNPDDTPATHSWTVDTIPPDTAITSSGPTTPTTSTSAAFTFTSTEPGTIRCSIDLGAYGACVSPLSLSSLSARAHSIDVQAIDAAGNADPTPARRSWSVAPALIPFSAFSGQEYYGNSAGGVAYNDACPAGQALIGFTIHVGPSINGLVAVCGTIGYSGGASGGTVQVSAGTTLPMRGTTGTPSNAFCPANQVVVGFRGASGTLLDRLTLRCAALTATPVAGGYNYVITSLTDLPSVGGSGGNFFNQTDCPEGTIATAARIRAGSNIDAFGMTCRF